VSAITDFNDRPIKSPKPAAHPVQHGVAQMMDAQKS